MSKSILSFVEVKESFLMAMGALVTNKLRSALTLLGVLVGVFSIIVVMTAMRALQNTIENELSQLGANCFEVRKWPAMFVGGPDGWEKYWRRKNFRYPLVKELRKRASMPLAIGASTGLWNAEASSRFHTTNPNIELMGVTPEVFDARNWNLDQGRAFQTSDMDSARNICVLGGSLAKTLFPIGSPMDENVKFRGVNYRVVGVLASKGGLGGDQDNFIAIPLSTGLNRFGWDRSLNVLVQARDQASYDDTVEQVRGVLRALRKVAPGKDDDFDIVSNTSLIKQFQSLTLAIRVGVTAVSSIALLAAGVGIMNIMLVSVTERTREIGIRRAVGAKQRNILTQFIMEAICICEVGGVMGVVAGLIAGNIVAKYLNVPAVIPVDWVIIGLVICSLVGIIFGTYPAIKAANIDPIDALRYE